MLGIILLLVFLKKELWKFLFLALVLLTFTPLFKFYHTSFYIFGLELTSLGLLTFHLVLNPEIPSALGIRRELSDNDLQKLDLQRRKEYERGIEAFEQRFMSKSLTELERIMEEQELGLEAI